MRTEYYVLSEYNLYSSHEGTPEKRIEIDRREFYREEDAIDFAKSLPCDIYSDPAGPAEERGNVYDIRHSAYRVELDYDGFPIESVMIGCRRLADEDLPRAVEAYIEDKGNGELCSGKWYPGDQSAASCTVPGGMESKDEDQDMELTIRLKSKLYRKISELAHAHGKCIDEVILTMLLREAYYYDLDERPNGKEEPEEDGMFEIGMGEDWDE